MTVVSSDLRNTYESARRQKFAPVGTIRATNTQDAIVELAQQANILSQVRVIPNPLLSWFQGTIYDCTGPLEAVHNVDLLEWFVKNFKDLSGWSVNTDRPCYDLPGPLGLGDTFVSWATGDDAANDGSIDHPYKTVKKAITTTNGQIWILPGVSKEVLDLRASARTVAGGTIARPMLIRNYGGPGTVAFVGQDLLAFEILWVADGTKPGAFLADATTRPTLTIQGILKRTLSTDPLRSIDGYQYEPLPHVAAHANILDIDVCWTVEAGIPYIHYYGQDVNALKVDFVIAYDTGATLTDADATMQGTTLYWEGIDFIGCKPPNLLWDATKPNIRPINYMKNCRMFFGYFNNWHSEGAITYFQDCTPWMCCNGDGLNIYGRGAVTFQLLTVQNNSSWNSNFIQKFPAGGFLSIQGLGPSNHNNQGFTGHLQGSSISLNDYAYGNFGQNVAYVVNATPVSDQVVWIIGGKFLSPYGSFTNGVAPFTYPNVSLYGTSYVEHTQATGKTGQYGLDLAPGAICHSHRNSFDGNDAPINVNGGTVLDYNPVTGF